MEKKKIRIRTLLLLLAGAVLAALVFCFLANYIGGKEYIKLAAEQAMSGKADLETAAAEIKAGNFQAGEQASDEASKHFSQSLKNIEKFQDNRLAARILPSLNKKTIDATVSFIKTAEIISRSAGQASKLASGAQEIIDVKSFSFDSLDEESRRKIIVYAYQSAPEINGLAANLNLAQITLEKGEDSLIAIPFKKKIAWLDDQLKTVNKIMDDAKIMAQIIPELSGYPQESRFLIILQNNDELRPSGGFIGSYAVASIKDGLISSIESHDSYHLDMPSVGILSKEPPVPIKKYMKVENWYLRDANWSPDWPSSARQILENYNDELAAIGQEKENFIAVIGITPELISEILKITGPITVQGKEYNAANFQSQLQYEVEVAYKEQDIDSWNRKEVINEVIETLMGKISHLSHDKWPNVISALQTARSNRYLMAYFLDDRAQAVISQMQADGSLKSPSGDFLMAVDANLAAFKTDAVMEKKINYEIEEKSDGLYAKIRLIYSHNGGFDWRTTRYQSYTRVYAPIGSTVVSSSGYKDGIDVNEERSLNKTSFGLFFTVEPGEQGKEVSLEYKLPDYLWKNYLSSGMYNLFIQKQAGSRISSLDISFKSLEKKKKQDAHIESFRQDQSFSFKR